MVHPESQGQEKAGRETTPEELHLQESFLHPECLHASLLGHALCLSLSFERKRLFWCGTRWHFKITVLLVTNMAVSINPVP